ncbi:hypothetical protein KEM56_004135 [Ascosphaera pollenicola]|nr:hypothetical protein KEM56_004135 [Ascosphaera pollenicola]
MPGTYNFQPRQPLNPAAVRSSFSSTSTTPIHSTTASPRQGQAALHPATNGQQNPNNTSSGNGTTLSAAASARTAKQAANPLQLNLQSSRQVRSPQSPLYVPAVLRQTDRPPRLSPNPSQASLRNSSSSPRNGSVDISRQQQGNNGATFYSTAAATGPSSASGTEDEEDVYDLLQSEKIVISKEAEAEWFRGEKLGDVVGSPTREHWRADAVSPNCDYPGCRTSFGIFMRRHHCRHCGHVFCAAHTPSIVPLDQNARFHPNGEFGRACDMCYKAYLKWDRRRLWKLIAIERDIEEQRRFEAEGGGGDAENKSRGRVMLRPGVASRLGVPGEDPNDLLNGGGIGWPQHQVGSFLSGSVPRDWSWSTF